MFWGLLMLDNLLEIHVKERLNPPAEWAVHTIRLLPYPKAGQRTHDYKPQAIEVTGCTPRMTKAGKRSFVRGSDTRICIISVAEHEKWLADWEIREDKCYRCEGSAQEWAGWNVDTGIRTRPCSRCKATGKPPEKPTNKKAEP